MYWAIWVCLRRVLTDVSGLPGTIVAGIGTLLQMLGAQFALPSWGWIALGALLLFITAVRIEFKLLEEKRKVAKPEATMPLEKVVERIRGKNNIFGPNNSESLEVLKAFTLLEEKAATGAITIFGVKGIRYLNGGDRKHADAILKRLPIPSDFWNNNNIDYSAFLDDRIGVTVETSNPQSKFGSGYGYLWFDKLQIDAYWQLPQKKISWRKRLHFEGR